MSSCDQSHLARMVFRVNQLSRTVLALKVVRVGFEQVLCQPIENAAFIRS
jgi:hypothetical protein